MNINFITTYFSSLTIIGIGFMMIISLSYQKSWLFNWDDIQPRVKDSLKIYEYQSITCGIIGDGKAYPEEIETRNWIMKNASIAELWKLTEFPNGNIKAIAYEGLLKKNINNKAALIIKAIQDTSHFVYYDCGCLGQRMSIGTYLVRHILFIDDEIPPPPLAKTPENIKLSDFEIETILLEYKK